MIQLTNAPQKEKANPAARKVSDLSGRLSRVLRDLRKNSAFIFMSLPGILLVLVFSYLPMPGIIIAFKNFKANLGLWDSAWVGFKNFQFLFATDIAWRITINTVFLNTIFIITSIVGSLCLALLLNEVRIKFLARFYQSAVFFPYFISWVIVGLFGYALLNYDNGLLNMTLDKLGLDRIDWYKSPTLWPAILTITNLWKGAGYWSIVYLAAMMGISPEYYEAAELDGASRWKQIIRITLPLITPLIIINFLLSVGRIFFADFGMFYYVTRDSKLLYPTTDVIDTYVFRALRQLGDFGMAGAAGLYQSVVGFLTIMIANWVVKRIDPEKSIF
ncbi:MAG: sugar ABC transporter permease [Anaerolineae bacterium]|nr:sugar ABC transporter permease [Anaerolineae bacterium]